MTKKERSLNSETPFSYPRVFLFNDKYTYAVILNDGVQFVVFDCNFRIRWRNIMTLTNFVPDFVDNRFIFMPKFGNLCLALFGEIFHFEEYLESKEEVFKRPSNSFF